jgi:hypothetical protein
MTSKVYLIRIRTPRVLFDLVKRLQPIGEVLSFREINPADAYASDREHAPAAEPRVNPALGRKLNISEQEREARRQRALEMGNRRRNEVYVVLGPILKSNQYAPQDTIIKLLNATSVRPLRDGEWNSKNIGPYIEYALAQLTSPTDTPPEVPVTIAPRGSDTK